MSVFRRTVSSTSGVTTGSVLTFDTVVFDPDAATTSSVFTVPGSWDGMYGELIAGCRVTSSDINFGLAIQISTDGGSSWTTIARQDHNKGSPLAACIMSGPIVFSTGNQFRVLWLGNSRTRSDAISNFFSGRLFTASSRKMCKIYKATNQTFSSLQSFLADTLAWDTDSLADLGANGIRAPAGFDGYGVYMFATRLTSSLSTFACYCNIADNVDAQNYVYGQSIPGNSDVNWVTTGVVKVDEFDHFYGTMFEGESGTKTVVGGQESYLAAELFEL